MNREQRAQAVDGVQSRDLHATEGRLAARTSSQTLPCNSGIFSMRASTSHHGLPTPGCSIARARRAASSARCQLGMSWASTCSGRLSQIAPSAVPASSGPKIRVAPCVPMMVHFFKAPASHDHDRRRPILEVVFFRTEAGNEPVREWLRGLIREDRRTVGEDIKTAQFGWPIGMPLIRKLTTGLWEVRSHISTGIARVMFTVDGQTMVLLHGFQKKSQRTPPADLMTAKRRLAQLRSE